MKNTAQLVAMAAGLSQVAATGFGFLDAPKFTFPGNGDAFCLDDWKSGFDWKDLVPGSFDSYKGFKWDGFTCQDGFGKRDGLEERTFGGKCIVGKATKEKSSSPKISCDKTKGSKKTSIKEFHVRPEFDCDLEFHYTMPDGSSCKHRSPCSKDGTVVKNTQCGGATDVSIVFPEQPKAPKKDCDFAIPSIIFDCDKSTSTATTPSATASYPGNTPPPAVITSSSAVITSSAFEATSSTAVESGTTAVETPTSSIISTSYPVIPPPAGETSSVIIETTSSAVVETTSSAIVETTSSAVVETTSSAIVETTSSAIVETTSAYETSSAIVETTSSAVVETTSSAVESITSAIESTTSAVESVTSSVEFISSTATTEATSEATTFTSVTSYMTTSTVFSTSTTVITSCGPSVPDCPGGANGTATVTSVIAISTTICPVTETITSVSTPAGVPSSAAPTTEVPVETAVPSSTAPVEVGVSSTSPAGPVETLPCPSVVPSCLNTWLSTIGCKDNTDSACYCPDKAFVDNVFDCLYSHGESDENVAEAISYFQGICAPHASENPGIVTYPATITNILTATPAPQPTAVYTTIEVIATTVVPCTGSAGESSSSTVTISTYLSVPEVGFTTVSDSVGSTSVGIVPGPNTQPIAVTTPLAPSTVAATAPYPTGAFTTLTTPAPIAGTGSVFPAPTPSIVTGGAARMGAGVGFLGAVAMAVVAL